MGAESAFLIVEINGIQVEAPQEPALEEISITSEWGDNVSEAEITTTRFTFGLSAATTIKEFIEQNGRLVGCPIKMYMSDGIVQKIIFDGFINTKTVEFTGCYLVSCDVEKKYGVSVFAGRAQATTFDSLYQDGFITDSDFIYIPTVKNYFDGLETAIMSITLFTLSKELYESIERFQKAISEAVKTIPDIIAGPAVEILKVGQIAAIILQLIFQLAYIIAIIIAIIKLIKDLLEIFFPPLRYYATMKYVDMWRAFCSKLGLNFESSIYESPLWGNSAYLPVQDTKGSRQQSGGRGYPQALDPIYNVASFIENEKKKYQAKYKITGNTLRFEREDYWEDQANYELPDVVSDQDSGDNIWKDNSDEFSGTFKLNFSTDPTDLNTGFNFKGSNVVVGTQVSNVNPDLEDFRLDTGGVEIVLAEAMGVRKDELTGFEKFLRGILRFVDSLTGFLGNGTNFASKITNRIGALYLSDNIVSTPRMLILSGNRLQANQSTILTARILFENFHYIRSFDPAINPNPYQFWIFNDVQIPYCFSDQEKLENNNFINTVDGGSGEVRRVEYFIDGDGATMDFRIRKSGDEIDADFVTNIYEGGSKN